MLVSPVPATRFFNRDRFIKYGWGVVRLAAVVYVAFQVCTPGYTLAMYVASRRILAHAYIGGIGAYVNVEQGGLVLNVVLLLGAAACIAWDVVHFDYSLVVYLVKTFGGDFLAGKLDTLEWKLVLAFTVAVTAAVCVWEPQAHAYAGAYARIAVVLFAAQVFCEYGDAHYEHWVFFRHRFSYEVTSLVALFLLPGGLAPAELLVVQFDLFICWCYRLANAALVVRHSDVASKAAVKACFAVLGALTGQTIEHVTDAAVASAVLKQFSNKGKGLEAYLSCPSWSPAISLESIDGPLWRDMRADFDRVLKACPAVPRLQQITTEKARALVARVAAGGPVLDAEAVARLTVEVFVTYLFGEQAAAWSQNEVDAVCNCFVEASWEWRKEIAVRGKGSPAAKDAAVRLLVERLLPQSPALWALFGERWAEPRYYSLLLQPFLISPTVNTGDIMCAIALCPPGTPLDQCMRAYHPFPIFERYVDRPVVLDHPASAPSSSSSSTSSSSSSVPAPAAVSVPSHCLMFTTDFRGQDYPWPVFGAGPRACAGAHLAAPFLKILAQEFAALPPGRFVPTRGHKYSGRHLDGRASSEGWLAGATYFVRTIAHALYTAAAEARESRKT